MSGLYVEKKNMKNVQFRRTLLLFSSSLHIRQNTVTAAQAMMPSCDVAKVLSTYINKKYNTVAKKHLKDIEWLESTKSLS